MKAIFVPTDFSELASYAIPVAASLARRTGGKIILHHNVQTLARWNALTAEEQQQHPKVLQETIAAENKLNQLLGSGELRSLNCQKLITHGITYEQIMIHATDFHADVIVMGSHANLPNGKPFIDSNIQKVLRESSCPVITVRMPQDRVEWNTVLVPLSFNEDVYRAFKKIHYLARSLNSTVHLLYMNRPDKFKETRFIENQMEQFKSRYSDLRFETKVLDTFEMEKGLLQYIDELKPDYVALITHDHRHQPKYLISTAEAIVYHASVPIMTVPMLKEKPVEMPLSAPL